MTDLFEMVREFHKAFDVLPCLPTDAEKEHRLRLIAEEYKEVIDHKDNENLLKELCDLVYVCIGTAELFGWKFNDAFRRVHEANMSKLGEDGRPIRREDGKVLKGPNYAPADLQPCLPFGDNWL